MRIKNMKLKNKILATNLIVLFAVILVVVGISTHMFRSYFIEETRRNMEREHQLVTQGLDTVFNSSQDYLRIVSSDARLQESMLLLLQARGTADYFIHISKVTSTMAEILSNFIYPVTHIIGAAIVVDGEVIYSGYDIPNEYALQALPEGFLNKLRQTQRPVWSGLSRLPYDHTDDKNVLLVGKSILHKYRGEYLGECIFFVDELTLASSFTSDKNANGNIYIVDDTERVVSCADKTLIGKMLSPVPGTTLIADGEAPTEEKSASLFTARDGGKDIYAVTEYPRMQWRIVNTASYEIAAEKSNRTNILIFALTMGCILVLFMLSYLIAYTMIKPINSISTSMRKAGDGDFQVRETASYSGEMRIIASSFNTLMDKMERLIDEIYCEQRQRRENEFNILQAQINPHFLYNTIETIISFITLDMKAEATSAAMSLAKFYKFSLSSGKSMISIDEEIQLTLNYIKIQKLRYGDYFDYTIQAEDVGLYYIPKLTLQPLVENAIYHGIKGESHPGVITIRGYVEDNSVVLQVHDTGAGIAPERLPFLLTQELPHKKGSFGLANVHQRIQHKYGAPYGLHIESEVGSFTSVTVRIPKDTGETANGGRT